MIDPLPSTQALKITNLSLWYDEHRILSNIDLNIPQGSVISLIGPSGCGKSSFLRCCNRLTDEFPGCKVEGSIFFKNKDIYKSTDIVDVRKKIGMVFQKPNPFPKSIYDNVAYGPRIHGIKNKNGLLDDIVEKSLRQVSLWKEVQYRLKDNAMNLSGGQQQRLCIARAIATNPEVLLMDEPCSALDPSSTRAIEILIEKDLRQRFTIVMVTHSIQQAKKLSDTVALFDHGKIVEIGPPLQVFSHPQSQYAKDYVVTS